MFSTKSQILPGATTEPAAAAQPNAAAQAAGQPPMPPEAARKAAEVRL